MAWHAQVVTLTTKRKAQDQSIDGVLLVRPRVTTIAEAIAPQLHLPKKASADAGTSNRFPTEVSNPEIVTKAQ